ncbi:MAG: hypothetical protein V3V08_02735, partial [Nannocystaceae bacterium]
EDSFFELGVFLLQLGIFLLQLSECVQQRHAIVRSRYGNEVDPLFFFKTRSSRTENMGGSHREYWGLNGYLEGAVTMPACHRRSAPNPHCQITGRSGS